MSEEDSSSVSNRSKMSISKMPSSPMRPILLSLALLVLPLFTSCRKEQLPDNSSKSFVYPRPTKL